MIVNEILKISKSVNNGRSPLDVICSINEESGELSKEVRIKYGTIPSYKTPDEDGVFGESCDILLAVVDMIYLDNPNVTEDEILNKVKEKLSKWTTCENKIK